MSGQGAIAAAGGKRLWQPDGSSIYVDSEASCTSWCEHSRQATHEGGLWCPTNLASHFPAAPPMRCLEIPKRFRQALDSPESWRPGLLHGEPGRGKTYLAVRMLADPPGGRFVRVSAYLEEITEMRFVDNDPRWATAKRIQTAARIVIDDLGSEKLTESSLQTLYALIDYRWANELSTVVTSNLLPAEIAEIHGDRLASRILGFGPVRELKGRDRRLSPVLDLR